jgi:hypothetical protein
MLYFITETYLKNNTPITANVDVNNVTPYLATQAQLRIMPILGTTFYNDLLTKYNDSDICPDEEDSSSIHSAYYSMESSRRCCIWSSLQLKNKGLQTQFGDNSAHL